MQYDFIESELATPDSRDSYLVTRTIKAPDADYPNLKRFDVVTPGYTWHLRAISRTVTSSPSLSRSP